MNLLKKYLGILWIALALATAYFGFTTLGLQKLQSNKQDDFIFGIIIVFILLPIVVGGLSIFGWYAFKDEFAEK